MNPKLLSPDAWKTFAKRLNLQDNGLLKALTILDGLPADKHTERVKALKIIYDLAQKLKKAKEVLPSQEATKYVGSIVVEADTEAKGEAAAAAKIASLKPPDLSALKTAATAIGALPGVVKLWKTTKNECWTNESKFELALGVTTASVVVILSALAAEAPSAGASSLPLAGACVTLVVSIQKAIEYLIDLIKCYEDHPNVPRDRLKEAKEMLETLRKLKKVIETKTHELERWANTKMP